MKLLVMVALERGLNESCRHAVARCAVIEIENINTVAKKVEEVANQLKEDADDNVISLNACVLSD